VSGSRQPLAAPLAGKRDCGKPAELELDADGSAVQQIQQLFRLFESDERPTAIVVEPVAPDGMERVHSDLKAQPGGEPSRPPGPAHLISVLLVGESNDNPAGDDPILTSGVDLAVGRRSGQLERNWSPSHSTLWCYARRPSDEPGRGLRGTSTDDPAR
jgi:hypothetical protein